MGRPKFNITPEVLEQVEEMASKGLTDEQIAHCLGTSLSTIYRNKRNNDSFDSAIKRGQSQGIEQVINVLFNKAMSGDNTAMIFWLKNRAGWKDKTETDSNVKIELPKVIGLAKRK